MLQLFYTLTSLLTLLHPYNIIDTTIITKDPRIDILLEKQIKIQKQLHQKGFRLQLLSTTNRAEAFKMKSELLLRFPAQKTYLLYQEPYFKIRTGNFLTKPEAEHYKEDLSTFFSLPMYIIEDFIDLTSIQKDPLLK